MPLRAPPPMNPWLWSRTWGETYAAGLDPLGIGAAPARRAAGGAAGHGLRRLAVLPPAPAAARAARLPRLDQLAPVEKAELMQHFDDWATDRQITPRRRRRLPARARPASATPIWAATWCGPVPAPPASRASSCRTSRAWRPSTRSTRCACTAAPAAALPWPAWGGAQRYAFVAATGGHFAGVASIERLQRIGRAAPLMPWLTPTVQTFSVQQPLAALARQLQDFAPTVLITYPSCADALAQTQADGAAAAGAVGSVGRRRAAVGRTAHAHPQRPSAAACTTTTARPSSTPWPGNAPTAACT